LAYFVRFTPRSPIDVRTISQLTPESGRRPPVSARRGGTRFVVVLPLLYRGIAAGALLVFVNGVGEFVATVLLYTPQYRPLSIAISDELYYANYGTAASFGVIQVLLVLMVVVFMRRVEDPHQTGSLGR
jgi:iron(III) transport system permease protein